MNKFKIIPALLISIVNAYTARPVQSVQLNHDPCRAFANLNCLTERSLSRHESDILPGQNQMAVAWGDLFQWVRRHRGTKGIRRPGANRESFYCLIAPGKMEDSENFLKTTTSQLWNRTPRFVWQGTMKKIEVYAHGNSKPLWTKPLKDKDRSVVYDGPPLTPNAFGYYWQAQVKYPDPENGAFEFPRKSFTIMEDSLAKSLAQKLKAIDQQGLSEMERAQRRIAVFREEEYGANKKLALSGDIFNELYAMETLPPELATLKEQDLCPDEEDQAVTS